MNRQTLPINEILVIDRQRLDMGDLGSLRDSIRQFGLIQPIVVSQDKRLIAGGRRLAACQLLGKTDVDVVYRETLTEAELKLLELEENLQRKAETWQEETISVAAIHSLKRMAAALDGDDWGQMQTARMLGFKSHCNVNYSLKVAARLNASKDDVLWKCTSLLEAWDQIWQEEQDRTNAELARRQSENKIEIVEEEVPVYIQEIENMLENSQPVGENDNVEISGLRLRTYDTLSKAEAQQLYISNNLNLSDKFEEYWEFKQKQIEAKNTIDLSKILIHGDSIEYMYRGENAGRFDHIITDIPYGIDMDMLSQENTGMDIESTRKEHDVDYNIDLINNFFPAAFKCTNPHAFVITWCDAMLFSDMHYTATAAGFAVQRWPFHWIKPGGMNQAAQYNQTKATEIAIICRKPGATRVVNTGLNYEACGKDDICDAIDHPFAKPFKLWERLCTEVSIEGQLILDPFMGRGSGPVSMLQLKRRVIGVELNEAHYNAARYNVQNLHFLRLFSKAKFI